MARRKSDTPQKAAMREMMQGYLRDNDISIKSGTDVNSIMRDMMSVLLEGALDEELNEELGYSKYDYRNKDTDNSRNGHSKKTMHTSYGDMDVAIPRDRKGEYEPRLIQKYQNTVTQDMEEKIISMYAKGMSQRDIADTIEDIYGFEISHETISNITDQVIETANEWQNRPLKKFYTFLFVDCLYVNIRKDTETRSCAVYVVLGYDVNGIKDILGIWIGESEGKHYWMQIFDEIKNRGVEDILFISMDGVSGLEEGARSIFKDVVVQRCIVHLIRNSIKYIPSKDYKAFTAQLKKVYGAASLKSAEAEFERFKQTWSQYPGAVDVWIRNWTHVEQLFNYGSAVRKVMYTTNAIESINSSFRKVTKKGSFPSEDAVMKALYLRITELYKKWNNRSVPNWAMVRNQLSMDEKIQTRILKYENF